MKLFLWQAERGSRPTRRHPRDDPREDVGEHVGVGDGVVNAAFTALSRTAPRRP